MSKKEQRLLRRILVAGIIFSLSLPIHFRDTLFVRLGGSVFSHPLISYIEFFAFLIAYLIIGYEIILKAVRNIQDGQVFDENFLMTVATIGAFLIGEYPEGIAVMLFYQVGELFQSYALSHSRKSIADLMDIRPDYANVLREGNLVVVDPEDVQVGEVIIVKPGERIPLDGVIVEGRSYLDTSALTGESVPRNVTFGDEVISGCINQTGILTIEVKKEFGQSTVARILELVENASDKKSKSESFITRFARYYTPFVVYAAIALALIPPLMTGQPFIGWIYRALTFLVISCPCALVISVPLSFFGGIGGASKSGILVKGSNYLEMLANIETMVFDKTGTLTKGNFKVNEIHSQNMKREEVLELVAYAEEYSSHPIATSIKLAYDRNIDTSKIEDFEEISGHGVRALISGQEVLAGNEKLMGQYGIDYDQPTVNGTVVYVAVGGEYSGYVLIGDEIKEDAPLAIQSLKALGVKQTIMLTGDSDEVGQTVASQLNFDQGYTELLPADKVQKLEELMAHKSNKRMVAFVGDGINDAPVLARADVGIAMGGLGSDAAIEAADVVIMTDELSKISTVIQISKKTLRIASQNIVFSLLVKAIVLMLGAFGYANMWNAVFADVGVTVIAILNAMRALDVREFNRTVPVSTSEIQIT